MDFLFILKNYLQQLKYIKGYKFATEWKMSEKRE